MSISKKNAKALAVRYHAYLEARACDDHSGAQVWGKLLLEAQEATNIWLLERNNLQVMIELSRGHTEAAERAAERVAHV
jgi:hypothetical protein